MSSNLKLKNIVVKGNSIYIESYPVVGILSLIGFTDIVIGNTAQLYFKKFFRYSIDEVSFSEWRELTIPNLTNLSLNSKKTIRFEFRYDKIKQSGNVADLKLENLNVSYQENNQPLNISEISFENSVFSSFFNTSDIRILDWYINVLNKLYKKGIVPDFISRGVNEQEKEDYLQIWGSVAKFFAYYVALSQHFEKFQEDENLLYEFLTQRGIKIGQKLTYEALSDLTKQFLVNISKRGTRDIVSKKKKTKKLYDGEILRLIGYDENDEFLFANRAMQEIGWNILNSSPLYRGMSHIKNANKFVENDILTEFEIIGLYQSEWFTIDSQLDYHLYFIGKSKNTFSVRVEVQDRDNNSLKCRSYKTGEESNVFIQEGQFYRGDKFLPISLFLYNNEKKIFKDDTTTIKQGNDLILHPEASKIKFIVEASGDMTVQNTSFSLLKTPYSHGLLQVKNVIDFVFINNNHSMSFKEIVLFVEKYLIPYNQHLLSIDPLDDRIKENGEEEGDVKKTRWIAGEGYCDRNGWRGKDPVCEIITVRWIGEQETSYCKKAVRENGEVYYNGESHYLWLVEVDERGVKTGRKKLNLRDDPDFIAPTITNECRRKNI